MSKAIDKLESKVVQKDTLFDGRLVCRQYKSGYRFSIDSVLLAHFPTIQAGETILDLGAGCGILGLIFCYRHSEKKVSVTGIEYQSNLAELAQNNIGENGFEQLFKLIEADLRDYKSVLKPESYSLVVANPPFYTQGSGRVSRNPEAMAARHQDDFGLSGFIEAAAYCVKNRGRTVFIYPAEFIAELTTCLQENRLHPKKIQFHYSYPESEKATLVIVEAVKNGGVGSTVCGPCYIYQFKNGPYTDRVESMFSAGP